MALAESDLKPAGRSVYKVVCLFQKMQIAAFWFTTAWFSFSHSLKLFLKLKLLHDCGRCHLKSLVDCRVCSLLSEFAQENGDNSHLVD